MRMFLTPKWMLSHLFVLSMIVVMTAAGFWQLDRLDERKASNDEIRAASEAPARPIEDLLDDVAAGVDVPDQTAVIVDGDLLSGQELLIANRTFDTEPGFWWVAPVELGDGRIVAVSRGWIPRDVASGESPQPILEPANPVEIAGRLFESVDDGRVGSDVNGIPQLSRLDLEAVEEVLGVDVVDRWVQAIDPDWERGVLPIPVPRPTLDEGPHLSYAFQWFFFTAATIVAYALILRRRRREAAIESVPAA
ncbi:MAG: SURF1 family protein [Actinomycetota bacterium]